MTPGGVVDVPDEYPPLPDGSTVPFTPTTRPRPDDAHRERVLNKHRHGAVGYPGKTWFPKHWSDEDIMAAVDLATADPTAALLRLGDKIQFERIVDGELVRVHIRTDIAAQIFWNAYPPNGTIAP